MNKKSIDKESYLKANTGKEYIGEFIDEYGALSVIMKRPGHGQYYISGANYDWKSYHLITTYGTIYLDKIEEMIPLSYRNVALMKCVIHPGYRSTEALIKHFDIKESEYKTVRSKFVT
jgi:hypothetical protein